MSHSLSLRTLTLLLTISTLLLSGCRVPFFSRLYEAPRHEVMSFHTTIEASGLRRVAVLPLHRADNIGRAASAMDDSMTTALRELAIHEVLSSASNNGNYYYRMMSLKPIVLAPNNYSPYGTNYRSTAS